jgi:tRNA threonylcarbamoyladenosine biosynthesis protein TsaE
MSEETLEFLLEKEEELSFITDQIRQKDHAKIIILRGNLGAGKTAFVKAFCRNLGCHNQVSSPTFSLVNEYDCNGEKMYHIDLYRLDAVDEALDIGIEEYLYSGEYCFIEWPEIIQDLLPSDYVDVFIASTDENSRKLLISFK